jgi:hypothetical protein
MNIGNQIVIEFRNRHCRNNCHQNCEVSWNGFGFKFVCNCNCHNKKRGASEWGLQSATNAIMKVCYHSDEYGGTRSE